jgi:hypothetical protein
MNSIKTLMARGAEILGITKNFRPHSLRAVGVTLLANNSNISDAKRCHAARHATVNANRAYQTVDGRSEANRLIALGVALPSRPLSEVEDTIPFKDALKCTSEESQDEVEGSNKKQKGPDQEEEEIEFIDLAAANAESVTSDVTESCLAIHQKEKNRIPSKIILYLSLK